MIVDLNKIKASLSQNHLKPNSLIVAEQMPGRFVYKDMSLWIEKVILLINLSNNHYFFKKNYWASYNVPFFTEAREITGFKEIWSRFKAQEFNYESNTRGRLFSALQNRVQNTNDLKRLMLFNKFSNIY